MSTLWNVDVLELAGDAACLRVRMAHPDAGGFPRSHAFALRLLFDEAVGLDDSFRPAARGPLGEALTQANITDDDFLAAHASEFIAAVDVSDIRNAPFDEAATHRAIDREVESEGITRSASEEWEAAWDSRWRAYWRDEARVPSAVYSIRVTDPRWLAHLAPAMKWRSAAYCGTGPFLP